MKYDPIKARLGVVFSKNNFLRKLFYRLLDLLLLRAWHVHYQLKEFFYQNKKKKDIKVFDAGFGFGQYSWYISRKNPWWEIQGIELKEEQVEDCNSFFKKNRTDKATFFSGDLTRYVKPDYYNLILSVDVMEHIEEDTQVFENFFKSLKPEGMLIISTPSDLGGSGVEHEHDESFIEEHVRDGYGKKEITEKLNHAGFSNIKVLYTYGKLGSISWKLSMKYPILLLGKSSLFYFLLPFYYLVVFPACMILNYLDVRRINKTGTGLLVKAYKN